MSNIKELEIAISKRNKLLEDLASVVKVWRDDLDVLCIASGCYVGELIGDSQLAKIYQLSEQLEKENKSDKTNR